MPAGQPVSVATLAGRTYWMQRGKVCLVADEGANGEDGTSWAKKDATPSDAHVSASLTASARDLRLTYRNEQHCTTGPEAAVSIREAEPNRRSRQIREEEDEREMPRALTRLDHHRDSPTLPVQRSFEARFHTQPVVARSCTSRTQKGNATVPTKLHVEHSVGQTAQHTALTASRIGILTPRLDPALLWLPCELARPPTSRPKIKHLLGHSSARRSAGLRAPSSDGMAAHQIVFQATLSPFASAVPRPETASSVWLRDRARRAGYIVALRDDPDNPLADATTCTDGAPCFERRSCGRSTSVLSSGALSRSALTVRSRRLETEVGVAPLMLIET
ncbi:hypothetical protein HETIRDRAFT_103229 [Heterobasidion irregulare TC 32-1]|uniref:Uncharacterized protein n=1 Tax=Heterobasidion irregulare (strain TC 32-1) TaxID=747525 RepID=W4KFT8_HETIT|nr:uncharacterized protein HETIRDRAFT_103229 [Heterobasidion irregulare TC 32-1]ETW84708.1 hypothetical protein HETIRDRAFT_103229 [Heterobasidion irregulare TC 32-1]